MVGILSLFLAGLSLRRSLLTGQEPFESKNEFQIIVGVLSEAMRPSIPGDCPRDYEQVMRSCWDHVPAARPTFPAILDSLNSAVQKQTETHTPIDQRTEQKLSFLRDTLRRSRLKLPTEEGSVDP